MEREHGSRDAWVALREITLQDFGPRPRPWDKWWQKAKRKSRIDWLIDGLESDDVELRKLSVAELAPIAGDDFNYDAEFEKRMRQNSIKMFRKWWSDQAWRES